MAGALMLAIAMQSLAPPARADLYSASSEYAKGDYAHALPDFLALAKLGQPQAQFNVAVMYRNGQGAAQSDIHAYAWAMLAAQEGDSKARSLADKIRPLLAPGSEQIAGWITAPYTTSALSRRLIPVRTSRTPEAEAQDRKWRRQCYPTTLFKWVYPEDARSRRIEGDTFVAFTLMPDGRARIPRVVLDVPPGIFGAATRESVLKDGFAPLPAGSPPVHCVIFYRFVIGTRPSSYEYPFLSGYVKNLREHANGGDPNSQLMYGMVLVGLPQIEQSTDAGLPWFLQAAQAGLPLAQFEVGYSLLMGIGCERDDGKALAWLRMAAHGC